MMALAAVPAQCQNYQNNLTKTGQYIATQQLSDGAILYSATEIDPYFANFAAIGWLKDSSTNRISAVEAWMNWYLAHVNWPDYNGVYGTVYNYSVSNGVETSTNSYDSADSYAATFLSLAEALWNTGDSGAQSFIKNTVGEYILNVTGNIVTNLQQSNGLVYAKPDYQIEYLMDNSEDYRGISDFATLATQAWNDTSTTSWYQAHASSILSGIQSVLYNSSTKLYLPYAGSPAPNMSTFYPDAVAQLWPGLEKVVTGSQANTSYSKFDAAWPGWPSLSFTTQNNPFPWCAISYAAYLANDKTNVNNYIVTIQNKYVNVNPDFPWPFYPGEGGWFMLTNAAMGGLK
jgi:hypothetical protein